jgi:ribosomal protein S18 acetylase RimI-like enzyme
MVAALETRPFQVLDLRGISATALGPVLEQEIQDWRENFDWDFRHLSELIRKLMRIQALNGYALLADQEPCGYAYYLTDEHKGLIGNLYLLPACRTVANENRLLGAVLNSLRSNPYIHRIESQLMLLSRCRREARPDAKFLRTWGRHFMEIPLAQISGLAPRAMSAPAVFMPWDDLWQEAAAVLIVEAYSGHVDAAINDQYCSVVGSRRFLTNIVHYAGCGNFFQPASYIAIEPVSRRLCGISLTSMLADGVGHITQICVAPSLQGKGIGYELLYRSLISLARAGCRKVSLTVTGENIPALRLYDRIGFRTRHTFTAMVWEGFGHGMKSEKGPS